VLCSRLRIGIYRPKAAVVNETGVQDFDIPALRIIGDWNFNMQVAICQIDEAVLYRKRGCKCWNTRFVHEALLRK
jgi:hypothetical protein